MSRRVRLLVALSLVVLSGAFLAGQAVRADDATVEATDARVGGDDYPSRYTLVTTQSTNGFTLGTGSVDVVAPNGERVWRYDPPGVRIFDGEVTDNGTLLLATGRQLQAENCPRRYREGGTCVHNRVVELAPGNKSVVWSYGWYDQYLDHHVVHDADRLENGWTAMADMGNHRAFAVDRQGNVVWSWHANESIARGTAFHERYGGPVQKGPESDWTHVNDVDRLRNGNFQLSIRNFDVLLEVDDETSEIVDVVGEPGNHTVLHRQHNPHRLERAGTVVVADSENNRVVELDVDSGAVLWSYYGGGAGQKHLAWPRDADRLRNGNTLITDSRNFRVIEVTPTGRVVWRYSPPGERAMVYEADRLHVSDVEKPDRLREAFAERHEEPDAVPSARTFAVDGGEESELVRRLYWLSSWSGYFLPWMGLPETLTALVGAFGSVWAGGEVAVPRLRSLLGRMW